MKRLLHLTSFALFPLLAFCAEGDDFTIRPYQPSEAELAVESAFDTTASFAAERAVARDFQARYPDNVAVQLRAANVLAMDNLDSTRAYYRLRAERQPENSVAQYLAGWLMPTPTEQRTYADRILARNPHDYFGNVLLASSLTIESDPEMRQAEAALRKAIAADNSLPYAVERLGHLLRARRDSEAADAVYEKLSRMRKDRFEPVQYRVALAAPDHKKAIRLIDEFLERNPKHVGALYSRARAERELSDWPAHIATMRRIVALSPTGDHAYDLACGFSLAGQKDSAFTYLFMAADSGFSDVDQYKSDEDLVPLRSDPRWSELLLRVETAEQAKLTEFIRKAMETAPQRKEEALSERQNAPAPDFALDDLDGKKIVLSDLRGKVVILDFWATWCVPCRKSMPLLDKFYTDSRPEGVVVFGVNVWERGNTDKVRPFLVERGTHFPILFGNDDVAEAYGVRGIPTLVVIDRQGRIAYRHVGYNPTLPEVLVWQTQELLKQ